MGSTIFFTMVVIVALNYVLKLKKWNWIKIGLTIGLVLALLVLVKPIYHLFDGFVTKGEYALYTAKPALNPDGTSNMEVGFNRNTLEIEYAPLGTKNHPVSGTPMVNAEKEWFDYFVQAAEAIKKGGSYCEKKYIDPNESGVGFLSFPNMGMSFIFGGNDGESIKLHVVRLTGDTQYSIPANDFYKLQPEVGRTAKVDNSLNKRIFVRCSYY